MDNLIELEYTDLALALALMAIAIGLSSWEKLGLENQLFFATVRSLLQLTVVGYILEFVFAIANPWLVLAAIATMISIAAIVTRNRIGKKLQRLLPLVWGSLVVSTAITLSYVIFLIIQPNLWYEPQYLIPLAGMIIGNAMNGAAIAGERLASKIDNSQIEIETYLSLGAKPQQAIANYRQEAIRAGLIPTLNQMMVVGLVTLPGMFTGQVLSGIDPLNAVSYQLLILFAIAFANLIATLLVTNGVYRQFFNDRQQLISP
ncbi:ABC transporter permease [Oscillatoria salina]|uniref:ABC transporter permease n=1 Tax=Oscillatoria salina TaxID=331517 RepID=UPI0013BE52D9|nr:iron export ABC transporter permease subunit FetB [Oscillatoria salina]MBZ8183008.1 iron export ABC transporter permease subunit FetB [Oscillatoria salina IIICB1]NET86631.1 iron export ABC transporter permease subunit FetB [Kamptonema sp. SIO1D9]